MKFYNNISENLFTRVTISFFFFIVSIVGTFVNHAVIILHNDFCQHLAVLFSLHTHSLPIQEDIPNSIATTEPNTITFFISLVF